MQYLEWLSKVFHGDFGASFQSGVPVGPELLNCIPVTLELALLAFLVANLIALPLGTIAAARVTGAGRTGCFPRLPLLGAVPNFWLSATLLVMVFDPAALAA